MSAIRKLGSWFWANLGNLALIGQAFVSAGFLPVLLSFSRGVQPYEYGLAALVGLLVFFTIRALRQRTKVWAADVKNRERLTADSSPFDPMARVYQDKRLFLKDLAPAGRRVVSGKKFINCEIIGPGNILVNTRSSETKPWPEFKNNLFHEGIDLIQIDPKAISNNAVFFPDCDFDSCNFYHLNLLFFERWGEVHWPWITRDANQPLLENKSDYTKP